MNSQQNSLFPTPSLSMGNSASSFDEDPLFDQEVAELFCPNKNSKQIFVEQPQVLPSQQCPPFLAAVCDLVNQQQQNSTNCAQMAPPAVSAEQLQQQNLQQQIELLQAQILQHQVHSAQQQAQVSSVSSVSSVASVCNDEEDDEEANPKPKKSLSAYNIFFQMERKKLLKVLPVKGKKPRKSHGKIGFADMARTIAARWKQITPEEKAEFQKLAALDKQRYKKELLEYQQRVKTPNTLRRSSSSISLNSACSTSNSSVASSQAGGEFSAWNFNHEASDAQLQEPLAMPAFNNNNEAASFHIPRQVSQSSFASMQENAAFTSPMFASAPIPLQVTTTMEPPALPEMDLFSDATSLEPVNIQTEPVSALDNESLDMLLNMLQ